MSDALIPTNQMDSNDESSLEELFLQAFELRSQFTTEGNEIKTIIHTIDDLGKLYASIEANGLSFKLLSFANFDNQLSNVISAIPVMESLTDDETQKQAALEGLLDNIRHLVGVAVDKISSLCKRVIQSIGIHYYSIGALEARVKRYVDKVRSKTFDAGELHTITARAYSYHEQQELLKAAICTNALIMDILQVELPENKENRDHFYATIEQKIQQHFGHLSILGMHAELNIPSKQRNNLGSHGYNTESFDNLVHGLTLYIEDMRTHTDRIDSEITHFEERTNSRLSEMVTTTNSHTAAINLSYTGNVTGSTTSGQVFTESYHILMHACEKIENISYHLSDRLWAEGAVSSSVMLGYLAKAYK